MNESADKQFRVTMTLSDAATVADGKLNVLGGGWNMTGPNPTPFAIGMVIEVPWQETNRRHKFRIDLIDLDGHAIGPVGADKPLVIEGEFEVGRPPGLRAGTSIPVPLVVRPPGPVQFPPGGQFEFRLSINGETREDWRLAFITRSVIEVPRAA
jgi:hypothetical protein